MMIEDEELRGLYQTTCQGRMQVLMSGWLASASIPDAEQLETLRREAHSLKGDSRVMGLEEIGTPAHHVERAIRGFQQQAIEWRSPLTDRLGDTLAAIAHLIDSATTGSPHTVDALQVGEQLQTAMAEATLDEAQPSETAKETSSETNSATSGETSGETTLSASWIASADVRSLYATTSDRRLQNLRQVLQQLSQDAKDSQSSTAFSTSGTLSTFRGEAQGLKGDSLAVGQGAVAAIAQRFEAIANRFMSHLASPQNELAPDLQSSLWQGLQLMEQLVSVAVNEAPATQPTPETLTQFLEELDTQAAHSLRAEPFSTEGAVGAAPQEMPLPAADLIEDTELREIYKETSEARLQRLETGLQQLAQAPEDRRVLQVLVQETHSLKGDAHSTGLPPIATLAEAMERTLQQIQSQEITLSAELSQGLRDCLMAMSALVQTATVGTVSSVNVPQLTQNLSVLAAQAPLPQTPPEISEPRPETVTQDAPDALSNAVSAIEDEELRDVYRTVSTERIGRLESGLAQLFNQSSAPEAISAANLETIAELLRETHSLKGDARSVELDRVASLAHAVESLLVSLKNQAVFAVSADEPTARATVFNTAVADVLYRALDAIAQLIDEAIAGLPVAMANTEQLLQQLQTITLSIDVTGQLVPESSADGLEEQTAQGLSESVALLQPEQSVAGDAAGLIEDNELREIYRTASAERLQKLEIGLVKLEREPESADTLAELLREAHSLKGDARSIGLDQVGSLAHAVESVLIGIQNKTVPLAGELSDLLYESLDAIAAHIEAAITRLSPADQAKANSQTEQLLAQLQEIAPTLADASAQIDLSLTDRQPTERLATRSSVSEPSPESAQSTRSLQRNEPYKIETIRVQTRDLDTLAAQAEQLTLTRIQTAQTTAKMTQLLNLWGQWRTYHNTHPTAGQPEDALNPYEGQLDTLINQLRIATQENSFRLDLLSQDLVQQVQTLRLLPLESLLRTFPRVVRDLARQQSKSVELITEGGETTADKRILEDIQDSLMHLVRNALDHGIETPEEREAAGKPPVATLQIRSYQSPNSIVIEVADDGRGLDLEKIKQTAIRRKLISSEELSELSPEQVQELIFVPGFSTRSFTTELSGRGVGLDVVRDRVERLKGNIQLESTPGEGCTFRLQISTQLATANVVFIQVRGITHALPIEFLQTTMRISRDEIESVEGKDTIQWNGYTVPITDLFDVLELDNSVAYQPPEMPVPDNQKSCLLLKVGDELGAFLVDRLLDTQEVIFKPQSALLKRVRNVTGATILGNGDVCTILNPPDLIKSIQRKNEVVAFSRSESARPRKSLILLVEDSPPVRVQEKRLFENAGYEVVTAENGMEGYQILREGNFDAVVSDIEMPELDGLALTSKIRQHQEYDELPIVLVTTLSSETDRQKGANAGANAYIMKGKFNQEVLLETLHRLI